FVQAGMTRTRTAARMYFTAGNLTAADDLGRRSVRIADVANDLPRPIGLPLPRRHVFPAVGDFGATVFGLEPQRIAAPRDRLVARDEDVVRREAGICDRHRAKETGKGLLDRGR